MRKEYLEELENLKLKMEKAEAFASELPLFEKQIIKQKFTKEDFHITFDSYFGECYLGWNVIRRKFNSEEITNYQEDYEGTKTLFKVYVNNYSLFDYHEKFDIEKYLTTDLYFFYDNLNSTYYITDDCITRFSEKFSEWYKLAKEKSIEHKKQLKIKELEAELIKARNNL